MKIKVINRSSFDLPRYETAMAAGLDIKANIEESIVIKPLARAIVPTGLFVEIPEGYEIQIRPRSGLAAKFGITVLNSPGTIDADYRGEIKVILANISDSDFTVAPGERIAQMVVARYEQITWEDVPQLNDTQRGAGGFGSTNK